MRKFSLFFLLILLASSVQATPIEQGKAVFMEYCSGCHGKRADGRGPQALNLEPKPKNLRNAAFVRSLSDERMFSSISGGVRTTSMPAFEMILSEERRRSVIVYLRSLTQDQLNDSDLHDIAKETVSKNPIAITAISIKEGQRAFLEYCANCHGPKADGQGIVATNLNPKPRNLTAITSFRERTYIDYQADERLYSSITNGIPGTSMQPWGKVLKENERWNIINYLRSLVKH